jgi:hypothetical protein
MKRRDLRTGRPPATELIKRLCVYVIVIGGIVASLWLLGPFVAGIR